MGSWKKKTIATGLTLAVMICCCGNVFGDGAPSVWFGPTNDSFTGDIIIRTIQIPYDTLYTYYSTINWNAGMDGGGYCGLQAHPDGHEYHFSIWDPSNEEAITAPYTSPGTTTQAFGGEGTGLKAMNFTLGWTNGQWYSTAVRCWDVSDHTYFGYWIHDYSGDKWTHIVTMDFPMPGIRFSTGNGGFIEDWAGTGQNKRRYHIRESWKRNMSGTWYGMSQCWIAANADTGGTYDWNFDGGIENDYYFVESGGDSIPGSAFGGGRSATFSKSHPAEPQDPAIEFSITLATTNSVSWDVPVSSTPQFGYTVKVNAIEATSAIAPEARSVSISANPGSIVEVILEDIMGRSTSHSTAIGDQPRSHWKLDEISGTIAYDTQGNFNGTLMHDPTWQPAGGQIDGALAFDGNNDYVDLGTFNALSNATEFTVSCWVNPAQLPFDAHDGIMGIGSSGQRSPWIWGVNGTNGLRAQFETVSGGVNDCDLFMSDIEVNQWTHIALTWDGSTCTSYINGAFDNSDGTTGNQLISSSGTGYLGYIDGYSSWDGLLDDIRVYNYSLTSQDIIELYRQGRPGDLDQDGDVDLVDLSILKSQHLLQNSFTESAGLVVIEAEHYVENTPGSGSMAGSDWTQMTGSGSIGDGFMQALPDQGRSINSNLETYSPHLSYPIYFSTMGDYYLWVRGMAADSNADTVHYGADGTALSFDYNSAVAFPVFAGFSWTPQLGSGGRPVITIDSPGMYSLDFWMREDGTALDRFALTTDANYNPNSGEPTESVYQNLTYDLNDDGIMNLADYARLAHDWLTGVN